MVSVGEQWTTLPSSLEDGQSRARDWKRQQDSCYGCGFAGLKKLFGLRRGEDAEAEPVRRNRRETVEVDPAVSRLEQELEAKERDIRQAHSDRKAAEGRVQFLEKDGKMLELRARIAEQELETRVKELEAELTTAIALVDSTRAAAREATSERNDALRRAQLLERAQSEGQCCWPPMQVTGCLLLAAGRLFSAIERSATCCSPAERHRRFVRLRTLAKSIGRGQGRQLNFSGGQPGISVEQVVVAAAANPLRDSHGRAELINALIATEWKFISQWFEEQMRTLVEPMLQEQVSMMIPGVKLSIGRSCDLGSVPVKLQDIVTNNCTEAMPQTGETIENMQIIGRIDFHGNCIVDVSLGNEMGRMTAVGLQAKGIIVIELVKLTHAPPWFSGVRIFFPNRPQVDVQLETKLVGISFNANFFKKQLIQVLEDKVIAPYAVLPNRVSIPIGEHMEDFSLRNPRPQGVLRLALKSASDLPTSSAAGSWRFWKGAAKNEVDIDPYAVVTLGAQSFETRHVEKTLDPDWGEETHDLLVTDLEKQALSITVRDFDYGITSRKPSNFVGRVEVPVEELISNEHAENPEVHRKTLWSEAGWIPRGSVSLRAQWRPFAQASGEITKAMTSSENQWGLGARNRNRWGLAADVFYASGLEPTPDGTEHWASITVSGFQYPDNPDIVDNAVMTKETEVAWCDCPYKHGSRVMDNVGLDEEVLSKQERAELGKKMWRKKVKLGETAAEHEKNGRKLFDVVFDYPLWFLMDKVHDVKMTASVWRPAKGKTRCQGSNAGNVLLGSVEKTLAIRDGMTMELHCPLVGGSGSAEETGAVIKLRLQAFPLLPPMESSPDSRNKPVFWDQFGPGVAKAARGMCLNRTSVFEASAVAQGAVPGHISFAPESTPCEIEAGEEGEPAAPESATEVAKPWFAGFRWFARSAAPVAAAASSEATDDRPSARGEHPDHIYTARSCAEPPVLDEAETSPRQFPDDLPALEEATPTSKDSHIAATPDAVPPKGVEGDERQATNAGGTWRLLSWWRGGNQAPTAASPPKLDGLAELEELPHHDGQDSLATATPSRASNVDREPSLTDDELADQPAVQRFVTSKSTDDQRPLKRVKSDSELVRYGEKTEENKDGDQQNASSPDLQELVKTKHESFIVTTPPRRLFDSLFRRTSSPANTSPNSPASTTPAVPFALPPAVASPEASDAASSAPSTPSRPSKASGGPMPRTLSWPRRQASHEDIVQDAPEVAAMPVFYGEADDGTTDMTAETERLADIGFEDAGDSSATSTCDQDTTDAPMAPRRPEGSGSSEGSSGRSFWAALPRWRK